MAGVARWPFVGRQEELSTVLGLLEGAARPGAVLVGAAGVGRSRLAAEIVARVRHRGRMVVCCYGTAATATVPYGALASILPTDLASPPAGNPLRRAFEALRAHAPDRGVLLVVDDAHLLDDSSMALLDQMARHRLCVPLLTARHRVPPSLLGLSKDGVLTRVDVPTLTRDELVGALTTLLGDAVEEVTVRRLWAWSAGNPLYLRELVDAGLRTRALAAMDGLWMWRGPVPMRDSLADAVEAHLGPLAAEERHTLELAAYADTIGLDLLIALAPAPTVVDELEGRGLLEIQHTGRRVDVRVAHPLHALLLRTTCPTHRSRVHQRRLAEAVEATGARRHGDLAQVATWRMNSRTDASVAVLTAGASQAWSARQVDVAARLGRAAVAGGAGARVGAILGSALLFGKAPAESETVLANLMAGVSEPDAVARLGCARAFNLFFGLGRTQEALAVLDQVARPSVPRTLLDALSHLRLAVRAHEERPETVLADWSTLGDGEPRLRAATGGDVARALPLLFAGRYAEAAGCLPGSPARRAAPWLDEASAWLRCWSDLAVGRLGAAERAATGRDGWDFFQPLWCGVRSHCALMRGAGQQAWRWAREGVTSLRPVPAPFDTPAWAQVAVAAAATGRVDVARRALGRAEKAALPAWRVYGFQADLSRPWVLAAEGRDREARAAALHGADRVREYGAHGYEAVALHDAVRLGAAEEVADRLGTVAKMLDNPLAHAFTAHAIAAGRGDPQALAEAAERFLGQGAALLAAEALTTAVRLYQRAGRTGAAQVASRRLALLTEHFDTVRIPGLACGRNGLTPRQFEVARLAASGLTNQAIADQLGTSKRTVDNHLYTAYSTLGVSGRLELAELLATYSSTR